ncbi:MAG: FliM/FliN family flagellar motor switch protein [bacterium]|nr:FliM/FliN family flagellar motor switch protein [bacterium]
MSITIKKIALAEQQEQSNGKAINNNYLGLVGNIEVECTVRIGTLNLSINQLQELKVGQVLQLEQKTHEPIEIILNNKVIARGELMSFAEHFTVKITEVSC